jgi:hypothetical protein
MTCVKHNNADNALNHRALEIEGGTAGEELIPATGGKHATKSRSGFPQQPLDTLAPALAPTIEPVKSLVAGVEWAHTRGGGAPAFHDSWTQRSGSNDSFCSFLLQERCHNLGISDRVYLRQLSRPTGRFSAQATLPIHGSARWTRSTDQCSAFFAKL